jgi:hypothetical protein
MTIRAVPFKTQHNNNHALRYKNVNYKQIHPHLIYSPNLLRDTRIKVTLFARPLLTADLQMLCRYERVFILEHHFSSQSLAALREA